MKMKKKILSAAVMAAALGAGSAQAANLSSDGTGQVLLFPYYTVQGNNETLLTIVNTTDKGKAVKVRFREAFNSREVLGFNLYLAFVQTKGFPLSLCVSINFIMASSNSLGWARCRMLRMAARSSTPRTTAAAPSKNYQSPEHFPGGIQSNHIDAKIRIVTDFEL